MPGEMRLSVIYASLLVLCGLFQPTPVSSLLPSSRGTALPRARSLRAPVWLHSKDSKYYPKRRVGEGGEPPEWEPPEFEENRRKAQERRLSHRKKSDVKREFLINMQRERNLRERRDTRAREFPGNAVPRLPQAEGLALKDLTVGQELTGVVRACKEYGAFVSFGGDMDGMIHRNAMTTGFCADTRDVVDPGDNVTVWVTHVDAAQRQLGLSLVPVASRPAPPRRPAAAGELAAPDVSERAPLTALVVDEQVWGQVIKVTEFGAFVDFGAEADGFLHVADVPFRVPRTPATENFAPGARLRLYVKEVDPASGRVKLTARQPASRPWVWAASLRS